MGCSVKEYSDKHDFEIESVSYAGNPKEHTAMYIAKKVEHLIKNLSGIENCLIFVEDSIGVPGALYEKNVIVKTPYPQREYVRFANKLAESIQRDELNRKYTLTSEGYYLGENARIGKSSVIEPGCLIGHDVVIGDHAVIKTGARIKNAVVGDHFIAGENCAIGTASFTMTVNEEGNKIRIPTLGNIIIGSHVEVGALSNISCGSVASTVIEDYVKISSLVIVGHDSHLHRNVEIPAGAIIGGFNEIAEDAYVGLNATLRNRIEIGSRVTVGMGAVVTKSCKEEGTVIAGNPARAIR